MSSSREPAYLSRLEVRVYYPNPFALACRDRYGRAFADCVLVPDFRSSTGLFSTLRGQHKLKASGKHLFDAAVYKNDSDTSSFHTMVRELAHMTSEAKPTPFHLMLASVAEEGRLMRLYSQNIDCIDTQIPPLATNVPLNLKGPWPPTIQLHGGIEKMVCSKCGSLEPFNGSLFEGPEPPPCTTCREQDEVRTAFAGKRSHGIGKMRPRIVLYNEHNPDEEAIGNVSKADLRRVPDAVIVVGTSLKIPGVRRLVKEMCQLTRSRRDGFTAWINVDPEPQGAEFKDCWDLVVRGKCDDVAELAHLPRWDEQDIGVRNAYMVTGDELKEKRCKEALDRDRIDVLLEKKRRTPDSEATSAAVDDHSTEAKSKAFEHVQGGIITPRASPKPRHQLPAKALSKTKQSKLSFGPTSAKGVSTSEPKKITKAKRAAKPKKEKTKPKNGLNLTFKATKNVSGPEKQTVTPKKEPDSEPYSSDLSSPIDYPDDFGLPSLRPFVKAPEAIKYHIEFGQSPVEGDVCPRPSTPPPRERRDSTTATISPNSKPRSMGHLID